MILGWKIFWHSVRMVFGNFKQVLQIAVGPVIIAALAIFLTLLVLGIPAQAFTSGPDRLLMYSTGPLPVVLTIAMVVAMGTAALWIAVSWHRFILLEEHPSGLLPKFHSDRVLSYFGKSVLLGIVVVIAILPMPALFAVVPEDLAILTIPVFFLYSVVLLLVFYRLLIVLPAAAVGKPLKLREALAKTTGNGWAIIVLAILMFLFQTIAQALIYLSGAISFLDVLFSFFFSGLLLPMVNVSIMTTLYGLFVENRELT